MSIMDNPDPVYSPAGGPLPGRTQSLMSGVGMSRRIPLQWQKMHAHLRMCRLVWSPLQCA